MGRFLTFVILFSLILSIFSTKQSFGNVNRSTVPQFSFSVPVDCEGNKGCFIHKYFNRGGSSVRDWGCGTNTYYNSSYGSHFGTDIYTEGQDIENRSVLAAAEGEVVLAEGGYQFWGYVVIINHGNGFASMYAHLKPGSIIVSRGQQLSCGQQIATVGDSGGQSMYNYGPVHLHFEARYAPGVDISSSLTAARSFLGLDESYTFDPFQSTCISPADSYGFWGSHPDYGSDRAPAPGFSCGGQNSNPSNDQDAGSNNSLEPDPPETENPETPENNDTSLPDNNNETYDAELIEKNIPSFSQPGQSVEISIVVKNTGNAIWSRAKLVKLFSTSANTVLWKDTDPSPASANNCNSSSACLSNSENVSEGDTHSFQFLIVTPPEQGKYKFAAQLAFGNEHTLFGPTIKKSICVGTTEFCGQPENTIDEGENDDHDTNSMQVDDTIILSHRIGIAKKTVITASLETTKNIVSYEWNFGDNTDINSNAKPTHIYQDHGLYTISLKYEDRDKVRYSLESSVLINDSINDIANNLIGETDALHKTSETNQQSPKPVSSGCQSANFNDNMYWICILVFLMINTRYRIKHRE